MQVERSEGEFASMERVNQTSMKQNLERISDQITGNIYINRIRLSDMRQHVVWKQQRLDTSEAISNELEEYCEALAVVNKDT